MNGRWKFVLFAALFVYVFSKIKAVGFDRRGSLILAISDKWFVNLQVMPFHDYAERMESIWVFMEELYTGLMMQKMDDLPMFDGEMDDSFEEEE